MTQYFTPKYPIGTIVIDGTKRSRIIAVLNDMVVLRPEGADGNDHQDFFISVDDISKKMTCVDFELKLPALKCLHGSTPLADGRSEFVDLADDEQHKVLYTLGAMMVLTDYMENAKVKITEAWIDANHAEIEGKTNARFRQVTGQAKRRSKATATFDLPAGKKLARMFKDYQSEFFTPSAFASGHNRAGRKATEYPDWVIRLMKESAKKYLDGLEKNVKHCFIRLEGMLQAENARRAGTDPGHENIKVSETKYRKFVASMPSAAVMATRKGRDEMIRSMRTGIGEMIARMVGEVVEIDECEMPLWVFLEKAGLHKVVGEKTMARLRKEAENETVGKVWILVAYDVASGTPLAFHIARSQNADDTLEYPS